MSGTGLDESPGSATAGLVAAATLAISVLPGWLPARVVSWHGPGEPFPPITAFPASVTVVVDQLTARSIRVAGDAQPWERVVSTPNGYEAVGPYLATASNPTGAIRVPYFLPGAPSGKIRAAAKPGDTGILLISSRSTERWAQGDRGPGGSAPDPILSIAPILSLASALFVPGAVIGGAPAVSEKAGGSYGPTVVLALSGEAGALGPVSLTLSDAGVWTLTGSSIALGGDAALPLALQAQVKAVLSAFQALVTADSAFWATYPDPLVSTYYTSPARAAAITALSIALGACIGTSIVRGI